MNNTTVNERKTNDSKRSEKIINIITKVILYTGIAIGGILLLVALYQILQYLFIGAILLVAWLCPRRWW